jgi:short subunit dehydrogenase-like uncharacterized protein
LNVRDKGAPVLLYGVNGYSGSLILPKLIERGITVRAAGRTASKVQQIASRWGIPAAVFPLSDASAVDEAVRQSVMVLNVAGPFAHTAPNLIDACLRQGVDYLDLSGELEPLVYARQTDRWARTLDVMVLPAVGFDVVPSDCLAVHACRQLPGAQHLRLYIAASNLLSRGSALTLIEHAGRWINTRRAGQLTSMPFRILHQWADFGDGPRLVVAVNWGDLVTAHHSTEIPNIEVFFEATAFRWGAVLMNQMGGELLRRPELQRYLAHAAELIPGGPDSRARATATSTIVAEVIRGDECYRSRLHTPEAYTFTAEIAARVAERVLAGDRKPGFCTPGVLFGPDFVFEVAGVRRIDDA